MYDILGRQNEYRNRDFAKKIAEETAGEFIDKEFKDCFGSYWIVLWKPDSRKGKGEH